jgi:hypothetical protein
MVRLLRRLVLASLLVGGAVFVIKKRRAPVSAGPSTAVPSRATGGARSPVAAEPRPFVSVSDPTETPTWVPPTDGQCPDGYPIKANDNSGIFHSPGGRFYDRTVPERCYANAEAAAADGYRAAKA